MGKFGRKLSGALKKIMWLSSSHSRGSSSAHYAEPEGSLMHEDEETTPMEAQEQEHPMEEDDAPHLDLEGDQVTQVYALIREREFVHTPAYDTDLLEKIGMDVEFSSIWKVVGWEDVAPV
jgi:hypothetical protein